MVRRNEILNPFRCHGVSKDGIDISQCLLTKFRGHFLFLFFETKKKEPPWQQLEYPWNIQALNPIVY